MEKVVQLTHSEDIFFKNTRLPFINSKGKTIVRDVVFVRDLTEYLRRVHDKLGLDFAETHLKIGIDSGRGSLKVCVTIADKSKLSESESSLEFNSVKHLIILCVGNLSFRHAFIQGTSSSLFLP